jgi:hypothetical protein
MSPLDSVAAKLWEEIQRKNKEREGKDKRFDPIDVV